MDVLKVKHHETFLAQCKQVNCIGAGWPDTHSGELEGERYDGLQQWWGKTEIYIDRGSGPIWKSKVISPCQASFQTLLWSGHSPSPPLPDNSTSLF